MSTNPALRRVHVEVECLDDEDTMSAPGAGLFENVWQAVENVSPELEAAGVQVRLERLPISEATTIRLAAIFVDGILAEEWLGDAALTLGYPSTGAIAHTIRTAAGLIPGGPVRPVNQAHEQADEQADVTFVTSEASS